MRGGLGRRHAPDKRDEGFALSRLSTTRTIRYWYEGAWRGDQGQTSQCVAYAWSHFICGDPFTHTSPPIAPADLYHSAQLVDEWDGTDYDGTSVRAGAKALQSAGLIGPYLWAWDIGTIVANILERGPVTIGVPFYEGMENPDETTAMVRVTGSVLGGHAMLADGVNADLKKIRLLNSWGREWGRDGRCWISFADFARLLVEDGEACCATEIGG
jgi:hypothetical protein